MFLSRTSQWTYPQLSSRASERSECDPGTQGGVGRGRPPGSRIGPARPRRHAIGACQATRGAVRDDVLYRATVPTRVSLTSLPWAALGCPGLPWPNRP
jgi:hypothetical protein